MTTYQIDTYGRTYRSNGPTTGWKGSIGGLTAEYVLSQIEHHEKRGESLTIWRKDIDKFISVESFQDGMR